MSEATRHRHPEPDPDWEAHVLAQQEAEGESDEARAFTRDVSNEARRMRIRETARYIVTADGWTPPTDFGRLDKQLLVNDPPEQWLIDGLLQIGHNLNIVAAGKVGKTTVVLNMLRSLVDGEPLFGKFEVAKIPEDRSVAWLNAELDPAQARRWLRDLGCKNTHLIHVLHLRGRDFDFRNPAVRDWAVGWLRERSVSVVAADPFAALFSGDENSNSEVSQWTKAYDLVKIEAGVDTSALVTHTGHSGTDDSDGGGFVRSRGASRLFDWPDVTWTYRYDETAGRAYLGTRRGRDIAVIPEFGLDYLESERRLTVAGTSTRREDRVVAQARLAQDAVSAHWSDKAKPMTKTDLESKLRGKTDERRAAIDHAVAKDWISREVVGKSQLHSPGTKSYRRIKMVGSDGK